MPETGIQTCTICGDEKTSGQTWFLVAESHWEDKLRILRWQDEVASRKGIHRACCPSHVQELVVHWMTVGSLDLALALPTEWLQRRSGSSIPVILEPDTGNAQPIGELSVHRESVDRALHESPEALQIILDELCAALERESAAPASRLESGFHPRAGWLRQM